MKQITLLTLLLSFLLSCAVLKADNYMEIKKVKSTFYNDVEILGSVQLLVLHKNTPVRKTLTDWNGNFEIEVKKGEIFGNMLCRLLS